MDQTPETNPEAAATDEAVDQLIDQMAATNQLQLIDNELTVIRTELLEHLSYKAICVGYGFSYEFDPNCHNTLHDDISNEWHAFFNLYDQMDPDNSLIYEIRLKKPDFHQLMKFWYVLGKQQTGLGFPYDSGGVSAAEFMAMTEDQRQALIHKIESS